MYIVSVIPLIKIPRPAPQLLDYFAAEKINSGGIVQIRVGTRTVLGIVVTCAPVSQKKQQIKISRFKLKSIEEAINRDSIIPPEHLKLILWTAAYFYSPLGLTARSLLPRAFVRPTKKFLNNLRDLESVYIRNLSERIESIPKPLIYQYNYDETAKIKSYTQEIGHALKNKKTVVFIVPELYKIDYFQEKIAHLKNAEVVHGALSSSAQLKIWLQARANHTKILIGTRSLLSIPSLNPGLIILDEEESPFYKSFDQQPYLNSRKVALKLAELCGSKIILGTNLPSVESLWKAKQGKYFIKSISIANHTSPNIEIIDMREELRNRNYSILSRELRRQLLEITESKKQAILFINRKGLNTGLLCRDCGHVVNCPNCEVAMVFHHAPVLICHHCGLRQTPPSVCPECESHRIKFIGTGTQRVEEETKKFLEENNTAIGKDVILRLDLDIAPTADAQNKILKKFIAKRPSILIGTQAMMKMALLPNIALAAIITIDPMLSLPDFRMNEQIIRLVSKLQALSPGKLLVQTYSVDNPTMQAVFNVLLETKNPAHIAYNKLLMVT